MDIKVTRIALSLHVAPPAVGTHQGGVLQAARASVLVEAQLLGTPFKLNKVTESELWVASVIVQIVENIPLYLMILRTASDYCTYCRCPTEVKCIQ